MNPSSGLWASAAAARRTAEAQVAKLRSFLADSGRPGSADSRAWKLEHLCARTSRRLAEAAAAAGRAAGPGLGSELVLRMSPRAALPGALVAVVARGVRGVRRPAARGAIVDELAARVVPYSCVDAYVAASLVAQAAELRRWRAVRQLHDAAEWRGAAGVDGFLETALVRGYLRARLPRLAADVVARMRRGTGGRAPPLAVSTALAAGLVDLGRPRDALEVVERAAREHPPDLRLRCVRVAALGRLRDWIGMERAAEEIRAAGFADHVVPAIARLRAYAAAGEARGVDAVLAEDVVPNQPYYTAAVRALAATGGRTRSALALLRRAGARGPAPDPVAWAALLRCCADFADWETGNAVLPNLRGASDLRAAVVHYTDARARAAAAAQSVEGDAPPN